MAGAVIDAGPDDAKDDGAEERVVCGCGCDAGDGSLRLLWYSRLRRRNGQKRAEGGDGQCSGSIRRHSVGGA
jgi:hypothetical protein